MRTATTQTFPENNKPNIVIIDNYGTTSMINFAQKLYNAGAISFVAFNKARKVAFSSEYATQLLNENLDLFPMQF